MALLKPARRGPELNDPATQEPPAQETYKPHGGYGSMARSKGALSGFLLIFLGVWGAVIPFVGPYFDFGYTPDSTWTWTAARFWYEVLPGAVTIAGALLLLFSANRAVATFGASAAAVCGAWFVVGPIFAPNLGIGSLGTPISISGWDRSLAAIGLFYGLGAVILYLASTALGRLSVRGVRDVRAAERRHEKRERTQQMETVAAERRDTEHREAMAYEEGRRREAADADRSREDAPATSPMVNRDEHSDMHDDNRVMTDRNDDSVMTDRTIDMRHENEREAEPAGRVRR